MNKVVAEFFDGQWMVIGSVKNPERANFVICCQYGDWSGFRTLNQCIAQKPTTHKRLDVSHWIEQR